MASSVAAEAVKIPAAELLSHLRVSEATLNVASKDMQKLSGWSARLMGQSGAVSELRHSTQVALNHVSLPEGAVVDAERGGAEALAATNNAAQFLTGAHDIVAEPLLVKGLQGEKVEALRFNSGSAMAQILMGQAALGEVPGAISPSQAHAIAVQAIRDAREGRAPLESLSDSAHAVSNSTAKVTDIVAQRLHEIAEGMHQ
jgi:hypothetical protein